LVTEIIQVYFTILLIICSLYQQLEGVGQLISIEVQTCLLASKSLVKRTGFSWASLAQAEEKLRLSIIGLTLLLFSPKTLSMRKICQRECFEHCNYYPVKKQSLWDFSGLGWIPRYVTSKKATNYSAAL